MTENERIFWNRVLELAQSQLKQATFDFFVSDAKLIKVEQNQATILIDDMKKLFWEKNLQPVLLTAGFEVFNTELLITYVFEEDQAEKELLQKLYESADLTEILPEEYQTSEEGADEKSQKKVSETQAVEVEEIRIE